MTTGDHQHQTDGSDEATIDLAIRLQLDEIESAQSTLKGKHREGSVDDTECALVDYQQVLSEQAHFHADRRMATSFARAVLMDADMLFQVSQEEDFTVADHVMAPSTGDEGASSTTMSTTHTVDDTTLAKLAGLYVSAEAGLELHKTLVERASSQRDHGLVDGSPSSSISPLNSHRHDGQSYRCEACQDSKTFFEVTEGACGHAYCRSCIRELFTLATTDESLFPPRCCTIAMPLGSVEIFLDKAVRQKFVERQAEMETSDRTYCSQRSCSAFVHPDQVSHDIAHCSQCDTQTCVVCKEKAHSGDCPADDALQEVLTIARESGWQRCHSCRGMVELHYGCNHITCRCGAQFCYACGAVWQTCACVEWDEGQLLARAGVLVERDMPVMHGQGPPPIERVQQAARLLRARHDCMHTSWRYVTGSHRCEECTFRLPLYIFECRQCRLRACNRCRRNRL